nr:uncharacterized protein LOC129267468 [Lytechinus pictus]
MEKITRETIPQVEKNFKEKFENLTMELEKLSVYAARENIVFLGIAEEGGPAEREDTQKVVIRDFMKEKLKMNEDDIRGVEFQRVHRCPAPRGPHPIKARMLRYPDKEKIMRNAKNLKGTKLMVTGDIVISSKFLRVQQSQPLPPDVQSMLKDPLIKDIIVAPGVLSEPAISSSVNGNREDMYETICDVVGSKPQVDIIWILNGVTQTDGNTIVQTHPTATPPLSNTRSVFTFPATQENFGQTLVCHATGYQLPDIDLQKSIVLDIHSSPSSAGTNVTADYVTEGTDRIRVICTAENEPSPTMRNYYIFSNGTLIHESMNSVTEVTVSNPEVGIKYTCMAGNYLGNTSLSAAVTYDPIRTTNPPLTTSM